MELIRTMTGCFMMEFPTKSPKAVELEEVNGGEDVFSASAKPDHLVVTVNGIIGSASDWKYAAVQFAKSHPDKVIVHCSECNSSMLTFDGVDMMGERLAGEYRWLMLLSVGLVCARSHLWLIRWVVL